MHDDDYCPNCNALERELDRECATYERTIDDLQQKLDDALDENKILNDQLCDIQWRMEGLEK